MVGKEKSATVQEGEIPGYNLLSHHQLLELVSTGGNAIVLRERNNYAECQHPRKHGSWGWLLREEAA